MKNMKQFLFAIVMIASTQASHAAVCINSTSDLKQSLQGFPQFMQKLPAYFESDDRSVRFKLKTWSNKGTEAFLGRWEHDSFGGGDLYARSICFDGKNFTMNLMDNSTFTAQVSNGDFIFKKFFKTYTLRQR